MIVKILPWCLGLLPGLCAAAGLEMPSWHGQATAMVSTGDSASFYGAGAVRYVPTLRWQYTMSPSRLADTEIAWNFGAAARATADGIEDDSLMLRPYRLTVRYSMDRFEARLGLQKISFGPAKILRPLQWFDTIDPRDPLKFTTGVYGLLCRYFFANNANLWTWGLYGNRDRRGMDLSAPVVERPEFGGRWQQPVPKGEVALSYHYRTLPLHAWPALPGTATERGTEHRVGFEAVWDIRAGVWCEAALLRLDVDAHTALWQELLCVGSDYTLKSGVHLLAEHLLNYNGPALDRTDERMNATAVQADYRLGMLDALVGIATADWTSGQTHLSCGWQRTLDRWQMSGTGYVKSKEGFTALAYDSGVQVMITFNH
jgi:hypothetical protein